MLHPARPPHVSVSALRAALCQEESLPGHRGSPGAAMRRMSALSAGRAVPSDPAPNTPTPQRHAPDTPTWSYSHVRVPALALGVKIAPASSVLVRHQGSWQATQHSNHIVLNGASHFIGLQKLRAVFQKPEDGCTAESCGHAEMGCWLGQRSQETTVTTAILPCDQMAHSSGFKYRGRPSLCPFTALACFPK